jgi:hypothetical protein
MFSPERPFFRSSSYRIVPGAGFRDDVSFAPCKFCTVGRPTFARWAVLIPTAFNSFSGPQYLWVQLFLTMFLFPHATFAWRGTFLQVAGDFLLDP